MGRRLTTSSAAGRGARLIERVVQLDNALVIEALHHLQLTVVVSAVEHDLFDCHALAGTLLARTPHNAEGAVAHDLLHAVAPPAALPEVAVGGDVQWHDGVEPTHDRTHSTSHGADLSV